MRLLSVVEDYLTPALLRLSVGLEWLSIDLERNIDYLVDGAADRIKDYLKARNFNPALYYYY